MLAASGAELSVIGSVIANDVKEVTSNIDGIPLTIPAAREDGLFMLGRIAIKNLLKPYAISIQSNKNR